MLFSDPTIAKLIQDSTEPVWESLRPVPKVTIDFGEGKSVERTLHGNIATWIVDARGRVIDVLPGIYDAPHYRAALEPILVFAAASGSLSDAPFRSAITRYHELRLANCRQQIAVRATFAGTAPGSAPPPSDPNTSPRNHQSFFAKRVLEEKVEDLLKPPSIPEDSRIFMAKRALELPLERSLSRTIIPSPSNTTIPGALAIDSEMSETQLRLRIHGRLISSEITTVEAHTPWLYKTILHADLTDPWLGLGPTLFGPDPFGDAEYHRTQRR